MKYTIEELPESRVAIDVEYEQQVLEAAVDRVARRLAQRARIPGFRPGKAPRYIIEMHFGRSTLYEEASEELIQKAFQEIMDKGEVDPVGQAHVEALELEPFSFRLIVPVRPAVTLGDYRALRFPEEVQEITDEDVEHALQHMQDDQTVWQEPDPLRPAQAGDRVTVDLLGVSGEKTIEDHKGAEIIVGNEDLLPGFEALVGAEVGQTLEIETTLPEEMKEEELAGQPATFTVTIQGLKEPDAPPLDDDFARNFGEGEETLAELQARLRGELEELARKRAREEVLVQMLDAVIEGATLEMPQAMIDSEAEALFEEQANQLKSYGITMDQFLQYSGQSEEEFRERFTAEAPGRLRRYLVLRELIRVEGIEEGPEMQEQLEELMLAIARGELEAAEGEEDTAAGPVEAEEGEELTPLEEAPAADEPEGDEVAPEEAPPVVDEPELEEEPPAEKVVEAEAAEAVEEDPPAEDEPEVVEAEAAEAVEKDPPIQE
jgi:trigger factor